MSYQRRSKEEWLTLINECRSSGLSDYDWCQRNGISHHTFYKAVRRLRASACEVPDQTGVLKPVETPVVKQDVVPIQIVDDPSSEDMSLMVKDDVPYIMTITRGATTVQVRNGIEPKLLESTLRALGLFLFCGRRCDRIKLLLWEPDGFVLLYKRLSVKGRYRWPRNREETRSLTWQQFDWLISGLENDPSGSPVRPGFERCSPGCIIQILIT